MRRAKNRGSDSYTCKARFCVSRLIAPLDAYVAEAVVRRLEDQDLKGDLGAVDAEVAAAMANARALRQRLDAFTDSAADGELTPAALARIEAKLRPQIDAADARVRSLVRSPLVGEIAGRDARIKWASLSVIQRRDVVRSMLTVRIHKTEKSKVSRPTDGSIDLLWT